MNLAYFQMLLQEAIDNATSTSDFLSLSQALEKLNLGQIRTVATYALLPAAAPNEGVLMWVTADERLYWSTGSAWFSIVADNQGLPWSWGQNSLGQLGYNDTTDRSSPVSVVGGMTDWCQISAGDGNTISVRSNGTAWAWGSNTIGKLGDNTTTNRSSPVSVVGGFSDWCQVSAGSCHTVAVKTGGSAWAWGYNSSGRLGDNTSVSKSSPVSVVGGITDWCQISAGFAHSVAVRMGGSAWAWGSGANGRLGDDAATIRSSPVSVVGGFSDWCQVRAGGSHTIALRTNGTTWAWGNNNYGQLGNDTTISISSPVSVIGGFTDWCQISAGFIHNAAVRTSGSVWTWGAGNLGRLGDNTATNKSSPVSVMGGFINWCQVSAGYRHSLGVRTNGSTWSWGSNANGRLGDGTVTNRSSPVSVIGGFTDWCQSSAGRYHSVALVKRDFT